jgi:hypothetical protein
LTFFNSLLKTAFAGTVRFVAGDMIMMRIRKLGSLFLALGMLAGCSTFHETGNEFKKAGGTIKEDLSKAGPAIKEDFKKIGPAMKEGFCEMGRDIKNAAGEAKESLKETFK